MLDGCPDLIVLLAGIAIGAVPRKTAETLYQRFLKK